MKARLLLLLVCLLTVPAAWAQQTTRPLADAFANAKASRTGVLVMDGLYTNPSRVQVYLPGSTTASKTEFSVTATAGNTIDVAQIFAMVDRMGWAFDDEFALLTLQESSGGQTIVRLKMIR